MDESIAAVSIATRLAKFAAEIYITSRYLKLFFYPSLLFSLL